MNKNKLTLILTLLLGACALWFLINNGKSTIDEALGNYAVSDTASINKLVLKNTTDSITLERVNAGTWKLNKKNGANMGTVRRLLYTINKLDIKAPVGKNDAEQIIKTLIATGVRCTIYQNGEVTKSYYVGGATPDSLGTYMVLVDVATNIPSQKPFIIHVPGYNNYLSNHYSLHVRDWKDKTLFNYNESDITSIKVETPNAPEKSFELNIHKNKYSIKMLKDNKSVNNIDSLSVKQYLTYYFNLNYENSDSLPTFTNQQPISIISVTDINGNINKVSFYKAKQDNSNSSANYNVNPTLLMAKLNDGEIVSVQLYLAGKLFQDIDYFINH